ncbi:hypothetical protein N7509_000601 [Penicillium cosmopolitanum]|uniref:Uncharacterized protein n=1 Tax=Penicillium cosmopolitanum TaxID=1131564 RepID=A0A9X0BED3_9EURO|nr:uncharacterized protein N7509_000601 [Penicillium cosmopolitanum]KAJ5413974.1 hypothetical protein N7509_000601 [Penicillium cosmopolitanum]
MASQGSSNPGRGPQQGSQQSSSSGGGIQDAAFYSAMLDNLLEIIRHAEHPSFSRVIAAIRAGASHDQISQLLEEVLQRSPRFLSRG